MTEPTNKRMRRAVLGYRRTEVEVALAELRLTLRHVQDDLADARGQAARAEAELRDTRIELDSRRAREAEIDRALDAAQQRMHEMELAAEAQARVLLAEAEEQAARTRSEAHLRSEVVGQQVDELLRLRDTLVQTFRGVIRDFDFAVDQVEKGESVLPAEQPQAPSPAANGHGNGNGSGNGRARTAEDERAFEGRVELDAGPFGDFAALSAFERSLAHIQGVEDVYVRRFSGDRALIELSLVHPLPLVGALRDHVAGGVEVERIEDGRVFVSVGVPASV